MTGAKLILDNWRAGNEDGRVTVDETGGCNSSFEDIKGGGSGDDGRGGTCLCSTGKE